MPDPDALTVDEPMQNGVFAPQALGLLARTLSVDAPGEGVEGVAVDALGCQRLEELIREHGEWLGGVDARVAAASWTNHLVTVLVPGLLTAWTVREVGVDASAANVALHLEGSRPRACQILDPTRVRTGRPARDVLLRALFADTLQSVFDLVQAVTDLPARMGWVHVGNLVAYVFDRLEESELATPNTQADRSRLLVADQAAWGAASNPLKQTVHAVELPPGAALSTYQVRSVCCLKTEIPGKDPCVSCPRIDGDRRARLLAERRRTV